MEGVDLTPVPGFFNFDALVRSQILRYLSGEEVRLGDGVAYDGQLGRVALLGTESSGCCCLKPSELEELLEHYPELKRVVKKNTSGKD